MECFGRQIERVITFIYQGNKGCAGDIHQGTGQGTTISDRREGKEKGGGKNERVVTESFFLKNASINKSANF